MRTQQPSIVPTGLYNPFDVFSPSDESLGIVDSDPQGSGTRGVRPKGGLPGQVRYEGNIPTFPCG